MNNSVTEIDIIVLSRIQTNAIICLRKLRLCSLILKLATTITLCENYRIKILLLNKFAFPFLFLIFIFIS